MPARVLFGVDEGGVLFEQEPGRAEDVFVVVDDEDLAALSVHRRLLSTTLRLVVFPFIRTMQVPCPGAAPVGSRGIIHQVSENEHLLS